MLKKYKQTEDYYKNQMLGFGTGSIYDFGCYLVSLCNGLNKSGYDFTPRTLNELLKEWQLYTGEFKNYIDVDRLSTILPDIFTSFKKIEPFTDVKNLQWYLSRDYVVLGKVNAKGIGGSGTHFVQVDKIDGSNAIIHDPYTDEYQAVAIRYGKLGNILGLRVFGVKEKDDLDKLDENLDNLDNSLDKEKELHEVTRQELRDARTQLSETKADYEEQKEIVSQLKKDIEEIAEQLTLPLASGKADIKGAIGRLLEVEEQKRVVERKLDNEEKKHDKETNDLKEEISKLRTEIEVQQKQNDTLLNRVNEMETKIDSQQEKTGLFLWLKNIFKI